MTETTNGSTAKDQLRSYVERIENLEAEKAERAGFIKDLFADAKSNGFDSKALRTVIRLRKLAESERRDQEAILATYMHALGMAEPLDSDTFAALPRRDTAPIEGIH